MLGWNLGWLEVWVCDDVCFEGRGFMWLILCGGLVKLVCCVLWMFVLESVNG